MNVEIEVPSALKVALPTASDPAVAAERFVSFQLGDALYAVHAGCVAEVTHPLPLTPLPDSPRQLQGIAPLRGEVTAVVDLRHLLSEAPASAANPKAKQIVLKRSVADGMGVAFVVDRLGEIATIQLDTILASSGGNDFLLGESATGDRTFRIVDHSKVLSALVQD